MTKERPISYKPPMVRAILEDRKTMTRRLRGLDRVNVMPDTYEVWGSNSGETGMVYNHPKPGDYSVLFRHKGIGETFYIKSPYGGPGHLLYVRETLHQNGELGLSYVADGEDIDEAVIPVDHKAYRDYAFCNVPSIHMPKWAARIWLEVESVRVERLQDISEEDAKAEGLGAFTKDNHLFKYGLEGWSWNQPIKGTPVMDTDPRMAFLKLWQSINGPESWDQNPWCWVITFKVLSKTGKP